MSNSTPKIGIQFAMISFIVFFFQCEDWIYNIIGGAPSWETDMVNIFSSRVFHGLNSHEPNMQILVNAFISTIMFNLLYGSFIYDELHSSGIYYFIRYQTRKKWFFRKIVQLLWSTLRFHIVYIGIIYIFSLKVSNELVNHHNLGLLCSYTAYLTIISFMTSILINMLSTKFGRVISFVITYASLVIMRSLVLSVGNMNLLGTPLELKALIPINLTLDSEGYFGTDTYLSLSITVLYCCTILMFYYHMMSQDNIGLLQEEKYI